MAQVEPHAKRLPAGAATEPPARPRRMEPDHLRARMPPRPATGRISRQYADDPGVMPARSDLGACGERSAGSKLGASDLPEPPNRCAGFCSRTRRHRLTFKWHRLEPAIARAVRGLSGERYCKRRCSRPGADHACRASIDRPQLPPLPQADTTQMAVRFTKTARPNIPPLSAALPGRSGIRVSLFRICCSRACL